MTMKRHYRSWWLFVLLAAALLVSVSVTAAQDAPPRLPVTPLPEAGQSALIFLMGIAGALVTAPITLFAVGLLKRVKALNPIKSEWLALIVALILTVVYWVAQLTGYDGQWNSLLHAVEVAGPAIVTLVGTLFGAGALYNSSAARNVPILGYQRKTPRTEQVSEALVQALQKMAAAPVPAAEIEKRIRRPEEMYDEG